MRIAGFALLALGLCVLGFQFTRVTLREIDEYTEPGPYRVDIASCTGDRSFASVAGTVTNEDDRERSYVLIVEFRTDGRVRARERIEVDDVPAGTTAPWSGGRYLTDLVAADLDCTLDEVTGPYPFGLEPAN